MTFSQAEEDGDEELNFSELGLGELLDEGYGYVEPVRGDIRQAVILQIDENEIVVALGAKRDGIIPPQDLERLDPDYLASLRVGDEIPVYVLNPSDRSGNLIVSLNLGLQGQDWKSAKQLLESGEMVEAEVIGHNKGGLLVRFGRLEGFVPASHLADVPQGLTGAERYGAMEAMVSQTIGLKIIEVNQGRRRLILSQREAQREWRGQQKQRLLDNLNEGDIVRGKVTGIRDFGVFVDIGGADGLIHVSELAWHRVPHPSDVLKVGEDIDVYVLELDHEKQRIALSLRRLEPDPWAVVEEHYKVGEIAEGTVSNVVDFGAFVVLDDGIEGLLHITEMADGTLKEAHSYLKRGDCVSVRVVRIEPERKRIGFSQQGLGLEHPTDKPSPEASVEVQEVDEQSEVATPTDEPALAAPEEQQEADEGQSEVDSPTDEPALAAAEEQQETNEAQSEVVSPADQPPPDALDGQVEAEGQEQDMSHESKT